MTTTDLRAEYREKREAYFMARSPAEIEAAEAALDAFMERLLAPQSAPDGDAYPEGTEFFTMRCGWCGAYEGSVSPAEPCARDHNTGEYIGPHQFGVYEKAPRGAALNAHGSVVGEPDVLRDRLTAELASARAVLDTDASHIGGIAMSWYEGKAKGLQVAITLLDIVERDALASRESVNAHGSVAGEPTREAWRDEVARQVTLLAHILDPSWDDGEYLNVTYCIDGIAAAGLSMLASRPSEPVPPEPSEYGGGALRERVINDLAFLGHNWPQHATVANAAIRLLSEPVPAPIGEDTRRLDFIERTGAALLPVEGNIMPAGTWAVEQAGDDVDMGPGPRGAIDEAMKVAARRSGATVPNTTEGT